MIEVKAEVSFVIRMDGEQAGKIERSISRILEAIDHVDPAVRNHLVNTSTVDHLLGLRTALINAADGLK
jgi:hypothetical protein